MGFYMFFCICFVSFHPGWDIPDVSLLYFLLKRNIGSCLQVLSCNVEVFSLNYCLFIGLSYFCSDNKHAFRLTGLTKYAINVSDLTSKTITQAIFFFLRNNRHLMDDIRKSIWTMSIRALNWTDACGECVMSFKREAFCISLKHVLSSIS